MFDTAGDDVGVEFPRFVTVADVQYSLARAALDVGLVVEAAGGDEQKQCGGNGVA